MKEDLYRAGQFRVFKGTMSLQFLRRQDRDISENEAEEGRVEKETKMSAEVRGGGGLRTLPKESQGMLHQKH